MRIYGVKILYRIEAGADVFYEESVVRVQAGSFDEAFRKAEEYAQGECMDEYENPYGETVRQSVAQIVDCFEAFDSEGDVQEVYSRILFGAGRDGRALAEELSEHADIAQMMAIRVREYNRAWTRREMQTLLTVFNYEPISRRELEMRLGGSVGRELGALLRDEFIEEIDQGDDHGRAVLYRTAAHFEEVFRADEYSDD